uniref:VWFD domain-containing protein n=1 Tax=Ornithorhynchus anatinus TaxID=9258 RepID=F7E5S9_ORNAN
MCGNFNGNPEDDILNPEGKPEADSLGLGNSWQVAGPVSCPPARPGNWTECSAGEQNVTSSPISCGLLASPEGPFRRCHASLAPAGYLESCVYDRCALGPDPGSLCRSLQAYADACQALGVAIEPWRNATFCPISCGANSRYVSCGPACPATCADPAAPSSCGRPCVEGCVCLEGHLLSHGRCVPRDRCGCWRDGQHLPVGEGFWTDDTCSVRCRCPAPGGRVTCSNASCPEDHHCGVADGVPGCQRHTYGVCRVHNDPHYNTFDGETHHFMGTCAYVLARVCGDAAGLPRFNVEAQNEHRGNPTVSYVRGVTVEVYGHQVRILKAEVDDVWRTIPVTVGGGLVEVSRSGRYVVLETDFRLSVSYDTDHSVEVKVPTAYFNRTCGMCGNFNRRRQDDFLMPDGSLAVDSNQLGNSWKVPGETPACPDVGTDPPRCPPELEDLYGQAPFCGLLTGPAGPFGPCRSAVDPGSFLESCVFDLCALEGSRSVLCNALEVYADACQRAGVAVLGWRNATSCRESPLLLGVPPGWED